MFLLLSANDRSELRAKGGRERLREASVEERKQAKHSSCRFEIMPRATPELIVPGTPVNR
jgi:hypothetical protein